jgi:hypothetical protein
LFVFVFFRADIYFHVPAFVCASDFAPRNSIVERLQLARAAFSARAQRLTAAIAASASDSSSMHDAASTVSATSASSSAASAASADAAVLMRAQGELHSVQLQLASLERVRAAAVALFEVDTKARFIAQHAVFSEVLPRPTGVDLGN